MGEDEGRININPWMCSILIEVGMEAIVGHAFTSFKIVFLIIIT
jgi:hypothetical protein